jgi:peptide methionine sulfoxide reductase MsrB
MNRIIQQFSVLNKIRHKERLRQGTNFARCPTHLFNDQPIPNQNYLINKTQLSPYQQYLVDTKSLERPFTGNLWAEISTGFYHCRVCDMRLFTYNHKYNANTGYASFWRAIDNRVKVLD